MWILILERTDGKRKVWRETFSTRAAAIGAISEVFAWRPETVRALVCEVNDQVNVHVTVQLIDEFGQEVKR